MIEAKFFTAGYMVAIDDIEFVNELTGNIPAPSNPCDATGWVDITTSEPEITNTPGPTTAGTTQKPIFTSKIQTDPILIPFRFIYLIIFLVAPAAGETGTIHCNFESSPCGWKPALNAEDTGFQVGAAEGISTSSVLYATTVVNVGDKVQVSSPISGNGGNRRIQVRSRMGNGLV